MKIAGKKNDGAWFRFNKFLVVQPLLNRSALGALLNASEYSDGAFNAITDLQSRTGITTVGEGFPTTKGQWIARMMDYGIPRQVWQGKLTFTVYDRTGVPGSYEYSPVGQSQFHYFGKILRKACIVWKLSIRELRDIADYGTIDEANPGGMPDASAPDRPPIV